MLQILLKIKAWDSFQLNFFFTGVFRSISDFQSSFFLQTIWLVNCKVAWRSMHSCYSLVSLGVRKLFFIGWNSIQQGWINVTTCSVKKFGRRRESAILFSCGAAGCHWLIFYLLEWLGKMLACNWLGEEYIDSTMGDWVYQFIYFPS